MIAVLVVVLFPIALLLFMLFMERVEEPLRRIATERDLEQFLDSASPSEIDAFVAEGTEPRVASIPTAFGADPEGQSRQANTRTLSTEVDRT